MNFVQDAQNLRIDIDSEAMMDRLGRLIAWELKPGDVVGLDGPLGAGKTRLVRAVIAALDCDQMWSGSPTFMLVQEYLGAIPVYHMDAYRLKDAAEFRDLGGEEYLYGDGVCLIEWSQRIADALPVDMLRVQIEVVSPTERRVVMTASGRRSGDLLVQIANACKSEETSV
jgi:tRNA threonylcarbamoyladenosine biosynthesis protein TsaE